uniref:Uncharacterized protein n=1 Tax=Aegilops tauschii subsp. strangulata TaxID=200361 RepID=A0A453NZ46_AEGTS
MLKPRIRPSLPEYSMHFSHLRSYRRQIESEICGVLCVASYVHCPSVHAQIKHSHITFKLLRKYLEIYAMPFSCALVTNFAACCVFRTAFTVHAHRAEPRLFNFPLLCFFMALSSV